VVRIKNLKLLKHLRKVKELGKQVGLLTNVQTNDSDWQLFQQFEKSMCEDKLYLKADLNREQVTQLLGIDKNHLAAIMQKYGNGSTLPAYINHLRIHHACQMLKDHPNYTIQAIATDSGFTSLRNFQRLFKDYTGMTPMDFKETLERESAGN
jgi:AraC-like DNA-binding protein